MRIYPLKFQPILKDKIWGGTKLKSILNKSSESKTIGESWEISGVDGNISEVSNGVYKGTSLTNMLINYKEDFLGIENYQKFGPKFPLLIKFLDATTNLSVQVHPDDHMAEKYHKSLGKTEMWYIMDSDENAEIILGIKEHYRNANILSNINARNVRDVFHMEQVQKGDCYFIPAGKVHAMGAGVLAAEIQQTSDVTYRVYDWDRTDDSGKERMLHTDKAIEATKLSPNYSKRDSIIKSNKNAPLVTCEYFSTQLLSVEGILFRDYSALDSFVVLMCVEGRVSITTNNFTDILSKGETVLLPALTQDIELRSQSAKLLEIYIPAAKTNAVRMAS